MDYKNYIYEGPSRLAMYGKDIMEDWVEYMYFKLQADLTTVNKNRMLQSTQFVIANSWTLDYFTFLYNRVGKKYKWWYYNYESKESMLKYLNNKNKQYITLMIDGEPSGMAIIKYDDPTPNWSDLKYFGICDHVIGKGYGKAFLNDCLAEASLRTEKMIVYTGSYDHPHALPNYKKAGFKIIKAEVTREYYPVSVLEV